MSEKEHFLQWLAETYNETIDEGGDCGMNKDLKLTIELVPSSLWGVNPRTLMGRRNWDSIRKQVYAHYHYHCGICQASNVQLNCHEQWEYNDEAHIQKLIGLIALCEMCHHCKHLGKAGLLAVDRKLDYQQVIQHFMQVNGCLREDFDRYKAEAFATWRARNEFTWKVDWGKYTHLLKSEEAAYD